MIFINWIKRHWHLFWLNHHKLEREFSWQETGKEYHLAMEKYHDQKFKSFLP